MDISVVIPCYNAGPWIVEALRSTAEQSYPPHEVIVIDDGSTDDSIERVQTSGVAVKLLRSDHVNAASARNLGIKEATGDWIALLDADDVWYPHHLRAAFDLLRGTGDVAYRAMVDVIDAAGHVGPLVWPSRDLITEPRTGLTHLDAIELEAKHFPFGHSTILYRRDRLREVGGFDAAQVKRHDIDLWLRMVDHRTWAYHPQPGVKYRADRPGRIGANLVDCEYYYLRAMLKNRAAY
ncbi:MAG: glycosyltransferase family 2 protein, partial [Tepidisphaeraceae bacterium]